MGLNLEDEFLSLMQQFPEVFEAPLLAGVSGGVDSIVMFELLHKYNCNISVAHCNFQLRGEESEADEKFVIALTKRYNVPCFVEKFNTEAYSKEKGFSIQMAARHLRMDFMERLRLQEHFRYICLAHHLDDNIETFFINLLRGTGLKGLKGMAVEKENTLRPLLFATKEEIIVYAKKNNFEYRLDSSNLRDNFIRNKIRHHIIPYFIHHFPEFKNKMKENLNRFSTGEALYKELCSKVATEIISKKNDNIYIDLSQLVCYENSVLLLSEFISTYGFSHLQAELMLKSAGKTETSAFRTSYYIAYIKGFLLEIRKHNQDKEEFFLLNSIDDFSELGLRISAEIIDYTAGMELHRNSQHAFADAEKVKFPLILRKWQKLDAFYPFGMKGKKLLSDFFTDKKLSPWQKKDIWILCSGNDILWVVGLRSDNRFRVENSTKKILHLYFADK